MNPPMPFIASITMDRLNSIGIIQTRDGNAESFPLNLPVDSTSAIAKSIYIPAENNLFLETIRGDKVKLEVPSLASLAPYGDRIVVYLDQKDWSTIAFAIHDPQRIDSVDERTAAEELVSLVETGKVVLPMSSGHMTETGKWTDSNGRYYLALTVAQLSRGWQMRHPLDVRRLELRQSISTKFNRAILAPLEVFTLEPWAAFGEAFAREGSGAVAGLPAEIAIATEAIICFESHFGAILDSEAIPMNSVSEWARANQDFTNWLAKGAGDTTRKRGSVRSHLRADLELELLSAAYQSDIDPNELET